MPFNFCPLPHIKATGLCTGYTRERRIRVLMTIDPGRKIRDIGGRNNISWYLCANRPEASKELPEGWWKKGVQVLPCWEPASDDLVAAVNGAKGNEGGSLLLDPFGNVLVPDNNECHTDSHTLWTRVGKVTAGVIEFGREPAPQQYTHHNCAPPSSAGLLPTWDGLLDGIKCRIQMGDGQVYACHPFGTLPSPRYRLKETTRPRSAAATAFVEAVWTAIQDRGFYVNYLGHAFAADETEEGRIRYLGACPFGDLFDDPCP